MSFLVREVVVRVQFVTNGYSVVVVSSSSGEGVIGVFDDNHVLRSSSSDGTVVLFSLVSSVSELCDGGSHRRVSESLGFSCVASTVVSWGSRCLCCLEPVSGRVDCEDDDRDFDAFLWCGSGEVASSPSSLPSPY